MLGRIVFAVTIPVVLTAGACMAVGAVLLMAAGAVRDASANHVPDGPVKANR